MLLEVNDCAEGDQERGYDDNAPQKRAHETPSATKLHTMPLARHSAL